jgi:hypothetical protein
MMTGMPVPVGTRQRYNPNPAGGRTPGLRRRFSVTGRFEKADHERLHQAADGAETTLSVVLTALVRRLEFDSDGRPTVHGQLLLPDPARDDALPLAM